MTETADSIGEPQFDPASAEVRLDEICLRLFRLAVDAEHRYRQAEVMGSSQAVRTEVGTRARTLLTCYAVAANLDEYDAACQIVEVANAEEG